MYNCVMISNELIRGTLKTIVLKLLSEQDRMYGYEITQKVKELSKEEILITEGALYPLLHQLEAEGLVISSSESIGKRLRKYYSLTPSGNETGKNKISEFARFIATMNVVLDLNPRPSF